MEHLNGSQTNRSSSIPFSSIQLTKFIKALLIALSGFILIKSVPMLGYRFAISYKIHQLEQDKLSEFADSDWAQFIDETIRAYQHLAVTITVDLITNLAVILTCFAVFCLLKNKRIVEDSQIFEDSEYIK